MTTPDSATIEAVARIDSLRERVARWANNPSKGSRVTVPLGELRAVLAALSEGRERGLEEAWRDGWAECKASLTKDEAFALTVDVEEDAWADSKTATAIRALRKGEG